MTSSKRCNLLRSISSLAEASALLSRPPAAVALLFHMPCHSSSVSRVQLGFIPQASNHPVAACRWLNAIAYIQPFARRYAWAAVSEWQCQQGVTQQGMQGPGAAGSSPADPMRRAYSVACMSQLQAKQAAAAQAAEPDEARR